MSFRAIEFYRDEKNKCLMINFLDELPDKVAQKTLAVFKYVENTQFVSKNIFKKLTDTNIWEIRVEYKNICYRYLSFFEKGSILILTHGFIKTKQKTPKIEIERAKRMKDDYLRRKK